uniref:Anterior and ectodermic-specific protein n=1 Tax=Xenopus tropicalis TaxID=8364 RepID=A0A803JWR1_XENTR
TDISHFISLYLSQNQGDGSAVFRPPPPPKGTGLPPSPPPKGTGLPPPVSHDLNKPSGHPEELRSAAPLPPKNPPKEPEHGRHRRDLHHGKAIPTGVPHHTGVHSGSGEISHPPRHEHSAFTHSAKPSEEKRPGHGQEHGKKPKH